MLVPLLLVSVALTGYSCAIPQFSPNFAFTCNYPGGYTTDGVSPFGDWYLVSLGWLVTCCMVMPLGFIDLDDNDAVQKGGFVAVITIILVWCALSLTQPAGLIYVTHFGGKYDTLMGTILFNFAIVYTLPSWANEKRPSVPIVKALTVSMFGATLLFSLLGYCGGAGFPPPSNNQTLLNQIYGLGTKISAVTFYLFPACVNLTTIPVNSIMQRYNLKEAGVCGPRMAAFLGVVSPWLIAIPLYTGSGYQTLVTWAGLILNSSVNFVFPPILYILAIRMYGTGPHAIRTLKEEALETGEKRERTHGSGGHSRTGASGKKDDGTGSLTARRGRSRRGSDGLELGGLSRTQTARGGVHRVRTEHDILRGGGGDDATSPVAVADGSGQATTETSRSRSRKSGTNIDRTAIAAVAEITTPQPPPSFIPIQAAPDTDVDADAGAARHPVEEEEAKENVEAKHQEWTEASPASVPPPTHAPHASISAKGHASRLSMSGTSSRIFKIKVGGGGATANSPLVSPGTIASPSAVNNATAATPTNNAAAAGGDPSTPSSGAFFDKETAAVASDAAAAAAAAAVAPLAVGALHGTSSFASSSRSSTPVPSPHQHGVQILPPLRPSDLTTDTDDAGNAHPSADPNHPGESGHHHTHGGGRLKDIAVFHVDGATIAVAAVLGSPIEPLERPVHHAHAHAGKRAPSLITHHNSSSSSSVAAAAPGGPSPFSTVPVLGARPLMVRAPTSEYAKPPPPPSYDAAMAPDESHLRSMSTVAAAEAATPLRSRMLDSIASPSGVDLSAAGGTHRGGADLDHDAEDGLEPHEEDGDGDPADEEADAEDQRLEQEYLQRTAEKEAARRQRTLRKLRKQREKAAAAAANPMEVAKEHETILALDLTPPHPKLHPFKFAVWLVALPWHISFFLTVPHSATSARFSRYWPVTLVMIVGWATLMAFFISWSSAVFTQNTGFHPFAFGIFVVGFFMRSPNLLTEYNSFRIGTGDLNRIFSNSVWQLLICLPFPWMLWSACNNLNPVIVFSGTQAILMLTLFLLSALMLILFKTYDWYMLRPVGMAACAIIALLILLVFLLDYNILLDLSPTFCEPGQTA